MEDLNQISPKAYGLAVTEEEDDDDDDEYTKRQITLTLIYQLIGSSNNEGYRQLK